MTSTDVPLGSHGMGFGGLARLAALAHLAELSEQARQAVDRSRDVDDRVPYLTETARSIRYEARELMRLAVAAERIEGADWQTIATAIGQDASEVQEAFGPLENEFRYTVLYPVREASSSPKIRSSELDESLERIDRTMAELGSFAQGTQAARRPIVGPDDHPQPVSGLLSQDPANNAVEAVGLIAQTALRLVNRDFPTGTNGEGVSRALLQLKLTVTRVSATEMGRPNDQSQVNEYEHTLREKFGLSAPEVGNVSGLAFNRASLAKLHGSFELRRLSDAARTALLSLVTANIKPGFLVAQAARVGRAVADLQVESAAVDIVKGSRVEDFEYDEYELTPEMQSRAETLREEIYLAQLEHQVPDAIGSSVPPHLKEARQTAVHLDEWLRGGYRFPDSPRARRVNLEASLRSSREALKQDQIEAAGIAWSVVRGTRDESPVVFGVTRELAMVTLGQIQTLMTGNTRTSTQPRTPGGGFTNGPSIA